MNGNKNTDLSGSGSSGTIKLKDIPVGTYSVKISCNFDTLRESTPVTVNIKKTPTTMGEVLCSLPTITANKSTAKVGEIVSFNWRAVNPGSKCYASLNGQKVGDVSGDYGTMSPTASAVGNYAATLTCTCLDTSVTSNPANVVVTAANSAPVRKVLTTTENTEVKRYITEVLNGAGTDQVKARTIYNRMTELNLDPQHIADAMGMSLADVNAYLAKK